MCGYDVETETRSMNCQKSGKLFIMKEKTRSRETCGKIGPTGKIQIRILSHILDGFSKTFSDVNESLFWMDSLRPFQK